MHTLFQKVKTLKKGVKINERCSNIRNKDSNLLTKDADILSLCLYNATQAKLQETCASDLLESEIRTAISKIKSRKAPGIDGIEGELIKGGGKAIVRIMHKICNKIWATGEFPMLWTKSLLVTIPKKGDTTKCENHRTISLI